MSGCCFRLLDEQAKRVIFSNKGMTGSIYFVCDCVWPRYQPNALMDFNEVLHTVFMVQSLGQVHLLVESFYRFQMMTISMSIKRLIIFEN